METFDLQNVLDGQALWVSVTGMSIVFSGLILISISIALLPNILNYMFRKAPEKSIAKPKIAEKVLEKKEKVPEQTPVPVVDEINDIASVIGLVLQLEQERLGKTENEQITIARNNNQPSAWSSAGRMRKMPRRRPHAQI